MEERTDTLLTEREVRLQTSSIKSSGFRSLKRRRRNLKAKWTHNQQMMCKLTKVISRRRRNHLTTKGRTKNKNLIIPIRILNHPEVEAGQRPRPNPKSKMGEAVEEVVVDEAIPSTRTSILQILRISLNKGSKRESITKQAT